MRKYKFVTVDVFTDRRFGGNPLAVFTNASGMSDDEMQALAAEMNLSETTFVLPPADPSNIARVRIFNRTAEMPFAGHPNVGTAYVLAGSDPACPHVLRFEEEAGLVEVRITRGEAGEVLGAQIDAPQPLQMLGELPVSETAECIGLVPGDVITDWHPPVRASVGVEFVLVEVRPDALPTAVPNLAAFQKLAAQGKPGRRLSIFFYCRDGTDIRSRMFAPLAGTWEDPATGSANATLGALLLSLSDASHLQFRSTQGVEMGRRSLLDVKAQRKPDGIHASVGGRCAQMFVGEALLDGA